MSAPWWDSNSKAPAAAPENRCFVGGLPWATDERSLHQAFASYGKVVDAEIVNDRETGRSCGFGFVNFESEHAIQGMNGGDIGGRNVTVSEAQFRGFRR
ncbi:hypothetical protein ACP70R_019060 [Stipagrostis hirtigluma subsp. patula]